MALYLEVGQMKHSDLLRQAKGYQIPMCGRWGERRRYNQETLSEGQLALFEYQPRVILMEQSMFPYNFF